MLLDARELRASQGLEVAVVLEVAAVVVVLEVATVVVEAAASTAATEATSTAATEATSTTATEATATLTEVVLWGRARARGQVSTTGGHHVVRLR
eukprot:CAMPEP_0176432290 /NCGR_PEP_ID=MMETSP0127-20121128/15309_1 /TAXON_ID=938130 /ORGANISM="Platyophrya macrostoma, Strain WH" /LENGTH=94 /DNA_ID=CAMNT_0017814439 /DNA_START=227 /DNA_END=508 /DNA_ORIENTATION=+